ncbi:MAG: T9SS type A sorting domain-containing protein, partial [Bacteroidaceae bacterium]|nr:T9SS type A sorting domain-containing protein [Bacteroidaceae bacterium]
TTTTSWAAYVVDASLIQGVDRLQIGVCAVGKDGRTKSDIVWSQYIEEPLTIIETLTLDKNVIKPNEEFTIGFEDPNHKPVDIKIYDAMTGQLKASVENAVTLTASLPAVGSYDVEVSNIDDTFMNRSLILVTPEETGRLPQVTKLEAVDKANMEDGGYVSYEASINKGDTYNGKPCTVSQSLYMSEPYQFTVDADILGDCYLTTSFALWFKVEKFEHASLGTLLMTKVNRNYGGTWTENVWGEMWTAIRPAGFATNNNIGRNNAENELSLCADAPPAGWREGYYEHNKSVDILSDGYSLMPGVWYHVCAVKDGWNLKLYLNGKEIASGVSRGTGPKNWRGAKFYVGGSMTNLASFTGWVDEVQVWSKALSQEEILVAMRGYKAAPTNLEGYFTFEETGVDNDGYIYFKNTGKKASTVPGGYMTIGKSENNATVDYKQNMFDTALGVPMLTGVSPVKYESSKWLVEGAKVNSSTDTTADVKYEVGEGNREVKVVATNSWGSVTKTITDYIVVTTGIDEVAASEAGYMIYPKPFEGVANVLFAQGGVYEVSVFAADGKQVVNEAVEVSDCEMREISMAGMPEGTYIVVISKNGKAVRSFKIVM